MKKILVLFVATLFLFIKSSAQIKGVTEKGDEVILYENGTWRYSEVFNDSDSIKTKALKFRKSNTSSFLLKSEKGNLGFWLDPKKWNFKKATTNSSAEFEIELKGQSLQAVIITEATEIPIGAYVSIALQNGKAAAPDIHIVNKEYRTVNDLKVLFLQMEGTQAGIKFIYSAYYYSNSNCTVQFVTYTYKSVMVKYAKEIEELLNGLVELKSNQTMSANSKNDNTPALEEPLIQGSFSSDSNCKKYFAGSWTYNTIDARDLNNKKVFVERSLYKTTEMIKNEKFVSEYETQWINNCSYNLIFRKTTRVNFNLIKIGEIINVEITYIDPKVMKYTATFRGAVTEGEMTRNEN